MATKNQTQNNQTQDFQLNMKLKSKSTRHLEKVKNGIRTILWQSAWAKYKQSANVSGQESAIKFWNEEFLPQWEASDYFQCGNIEVLESLLAESDMTVQDVLEEANEIAERKANFNNGNENSSRIATPRTMPEYENYEDIYEKPLY